MITERNERLLDIQSDLTLALRQVERAMSPQITPGQRESALDTVIEHVSDVLYELEGGLPDYTPPQMRPVRTTLRGTRSRRSR